jgi:tetratricopeptide (TPR) repeat protein
MRDFYDTSLLCNVAKSIALEALELPADERVGHFLAIDALLENWSSETAVPTLLESIPYAFVRQADALPSLQERVRFMRGQTADADVAPAQALTQAEADMRKEIGEVGAAPPPGQGTPQVSLPRGQVYGEASRSAEGDKTHLEALLQRVKDSLAGHRFDEAVQLCREAVQIAPGLGWAWALLGAVSHHELHQLAEAEQAYRKAIECRPEVAAGWASLGQLLHEELQQYHEAEQAYRKALELDARLAWVWGNLGLMLHQNLHRFEEAEQAFRKALELDPQLAAAWGYLGALLQQQPQRLAEAEQAYRKALELDPKFAAVRPSLSGLLLARGQEEEALREAERCLHDTLRSPEVLNGLAWCWRIHGKPQHLRQALLWAIDAERGQPDTSEIVHTLSCILGDLGKWKDALQRAPRFLRDRRMVGQSTVVVVAFFVAAAAAGHAEEGIRSLHGSPAADLLEPLEVALRLHAGEKVMVPREVREVAKDIVAQIEARRAARQGASPPSGGTPGPIS